MAGLYGINIKFLEEKGWLACPAYGGFFIETGENTYYLDSETGDVGLVSGLQIEALTLFNGVIETEAVSPSLDGDET